jgi:hypothetical protein
MTTLDDAEGLKPNGLLDRFALFVARRLDTMRQRSREATPAPAQSGEAQSAPPVSQYDGPAGLYQEMQDDFDRHSVATGAWKAFLSDGRAQAQIEGMAEHATAADSDGLPYKLTLDEEEGETDPRADAGFAIVEDTNTRLEMPDEAEAIVIRMALEGDAFRNVRANARGQIVGFDEIPGALEGYTMKKLLDRTTKEHTGWVLLDAQTRQVVRVYARWEVAHFPWKKTGNYGRSVLGASRLAFERQWQKEADMTTARHERAYPRVAHRYNANTTPAQLREIRNEAERDRLKRGRGVATDIYSTAEELDLHDPANAALGNIADVEYGERILLTAGRTPKGFLGGYGEAVNRAVLEKQEEAFIRVLSKINGIISRGYREVFETALLLQGILPDEVPYSFVWTEKKVGDFKGTMEALQIATNVGLDPISALQEAGWDPEVVLQNHRKWNEAMREIEGDVDRREQEEIARLTGGGRRDGGAPPDDDPEDDEEMESAAATNGRSGRFLVLESARRGARGARWRF